MYDEYYVDSGIPILYSYFSPIFSLLLIRNPICTRVWVFAKAQIGKSITNIERWKAWWILWRDLCYAVFYETHQDDYEEEEKILPNRVFHCAFTSYNIKFENRKIAFKILKSNTKLAQKLGSKFGKWQNSVSWFLHKKKKKIQ